MTRISRIAGDFRDGRLTFHQRMEQEMFADMLDLYERDRYAALATVGAVLYERLFTTRLIRETGFAGTPAKDNAAEQIRHLRDREQEIIDGTDPSKTRGLSFKAITRQLVNAGILTEAQKNNADSFYETYRNPVSHGLSYRLYETVFGQPPASPFHIDADYEELYKAVAETIIAEVHGWVSSGILLKQ